jgi:hypothetical protein
VGQADLIYTGVKYDSIEEVWVAMWFQELEEAGYVAKYIKNIRPMILTQGLKVPYKKITQLKTKLKVEDREKTLLNPSEYTPDFRAWFTEKGFDLFGSVTEVGDFDPEALFFVNNNGEQQKDMMMFVFEVKPAFDQNNMERLFRNNQKFVWDKHQIFVNLIEPVSLFKKTFLPLQAEADFKYRKAPTGKNKGKKKVGDWKMDWIPKTLNEFVCSN